MPEKSMQPSKVEWHSPQDPREMTPRTRILVLSTVAFACSDGARDAAPDGTHGGTAEESSSDGGAAPTDVDGVGIGGLRRLTVHEYDNAIRDLLGDDTRPGASALPEDRRTPFDNDFAVQLASRVLVEGAETLARDIAARTVADPARRDQVVGCQPSGVDDEACMRAFVERHGRRMLRRALTTEELDDFTALGLEIAAAAGGFDRGVEAVLRAFLQDPEFLYRLELGTPVEARPGLFRLGGYELATRMAFLVWGSTPDDALLERAELGELDEPDGRADALATMLADPRARVQIDRFHAQWLGYDQLPHPPALTNALRTETRMLVERVVFEAGHDWVELFTSGEAFLSPELAAHYGIDGIATEGWVDVASHGRMGVLGSGAFLSVASNVDDTSPTKRGKLVRERLMCQSIPPPPPDVMADVPPTALGGECRLDQYRAHGQGSCAGCHALMDPIGFGLERYDQLGRFREYEYFSEGLDLNDACPLDGQGQIAELGAFTDPAGLAQLLVDADIVQDCMVTQLYTFAMGHAPAADDARFVDALGQSFTDSGHRFDELLRAIVTDDAFAYRAEQE